MLGYVASFSGIGVVIGSIYVSNYGTPEGNRVKTMIILLAVQGAIMMSAILSPGVVVITIAGFFYLLLDPIIVSKL